MVTSFVNGPLHSKNIVSPVSVSTPSKSIPSREADTSTVGLSLTGNHAYVRSDPTVFSKLIDRYDQFIYISMADFFFEFPIVFFQFFLIC